MVIVLSGDKEKIKWYHPQTTIKTSDFLFVYVTSADSSFIEKRFFNEVLSSDEIVDFLNKNYKSILLPINYSEAVLFNGGRGATHGYPLYSFVLKKELIVELSKNISTYQKNEIQKNEGREFATSFELVFYLESILGEEIVREKIQLILKISPKQNGQINDYVHSVLSNSISFDSDYYNVPIIILQHNYNIQYSLGWLHQKDLLNILIKFKNEN